jgi:hypothetical protein
MRPKETLAVSGKLTHRLLYPQGSNPVALHRKLGGSNRRSALPGIKHRSSSPSPIHHTDCWLPMAGWCTVRFPG